MDDKIRPDQEHKKLNYLLRDIVTEEEYLQDKYPLDLYSIKELQNTFAYGLRMLVKRKQEFKLKKAIEDYKKHIPIIEKWLNEDKLTLDECAKKFNLEVRILFTDGQHLSMYLKRAKQRLKYPDLTFREINKLEKLENKKNKGNQIKDGYLR